MVYVRISSQQGSKLWIDDPRNLRARMHFAKQRHCGKRMDDVTERARLDDQDGFGVQGRRSKLLRLRRFVCHRLRRSRSTLGNKKVERVVLNALPSKMEFHRADPIFQSQVAQREAVATRLRQSSFARLPDYILRETVGPDYSPYRKCSTLRASFHHAAGPHCPC